MAEVESRVTIGLGVMMALTGVVLGSSPSPTTCAFVSEVPWTERQTHPERQILCRKDSAEVLILVDYENAVGALCGAELTRIGNADRVRDGEGGEGAEGGDGALLGARGGGSAAGTLGALRGGTLAGELGFDLLANGLWRMRR